MTRFLQTLFWSLVRLLSRARYRVRVVGSERLAELRGPTLVMPNHPAYIDPPLVMSHVRLRGGIRPTVFSGMYRNPVLYPMMRLANALEVPDLSEHSHDARQQTLAVIDAIVAGVERGESYLLYPSGRAQRRGLEEIGAARAAAEILQRCPAETNIVLVQHPRRLRQHVSPTRGPASPPRMVRAACCAGIGYTLASLLFFAPRRQRDHHRRGDRPQRVALGAWSGRRSIGTWKSWYNRLGPENADVRPVPSGSSGRATWDFPASGRVAAHVDLEQDPPRDDRGGQRV